MDSPVGIGLILRTYVQLYIFIIYYLDASVYYFTLQSGIGLIAASDLDDPDDRSYVVLSYLSTDAVYSDDDHVIEFTETQDQINNQRQGIGANTAQFIGIINIIPFSLDLWHCVPKGVFTRNVCVCVCVKRQK